MTSLFGVGIEEYQKHILTTICLPMLLIELAIYDK